MVSTDRREGGFPGYPLASKQPKETSVLIQPAAGEMIGEVPGARVKVPGCRWRRRRTEFEQQMVIRLPELEKSLFIVSCFSFGN